MVNEKNIIPTATRYIPILNGSPALYAFVTNTLPLKSVLSSSPLEITTSPVMEHVIIVVKNTLVIEISPCFTHESVFAAAATIGELPRPASFVYTPLATPVLMAVMNEITAVPAAPPSADCYENAQEKILANAPGIAA